MITSEHRESDSPLIACVWRAHSSGVETMTSVANSNWELVVWSEGGQQLASIRGPETRASIAPVPQDSHSFGISFAHGVSMPHLSARDLVDAQTRPQVITGDALLLDRRTWALPTYDSAESFVGRLAGAGVLVRDGLVAPVLDGHTPAASRRTVERRVAISTGLTAGMIRQITRARRAGCRLLAGQPILEVVHALGFYDQPHLSRSLSRFVGHTATELAGGTVHIPSLLIGSRLDGDPAAGGDIDPAR